MMLGTCGQPVSYATNWAVARLWQPLERPTLAQAEALFSWTMSSAVETRAPFYSALTSAGMPTTVTTVRMPVCCASHCDPACCSADHLFWEPVVVCPSSSRKPSFFDNCSSLGPSIPLPGKEPAQMLWSCMGEPGSSPSTYCVTSLTCHQLCGPNSMKAPTFCSAKIENWGKGMTPNSPLG